MASDPSGGGSVFRDEARKSHSVRRTLFVVVVLALVVFFLVPRLAGFRQAMDTVTRLQWWLLPFAVGFEAASLAWYAALVRWVLSAEGATLPAGRVRLAVLVGSAWGKVLPGSNVAALPVVARVLQREGVDAAVSTAAFVASGAISSLVLAAFFPVTAAVALLARQSGAVPVGVVGIAGGTVALVLLGWMGLRDPDLGRRLANFLRRRIPGRRAARLLHLEEAASGVERAVTELHIFVHAPRRVIRAAWLAALSWICDFAVVAAIAVIGTRGAPLAGLGLAYIVGHLAAAIPLTPGGLGVVETTVVASLAAQGVPAGQAAAVVLAWRLVSYWLPLAAGLAADVAMRSRPGSRHEV